MRGVSSGVSGTENELKALACDKTCTRLGDSICVGSHLERRRPPVGSSAGALSVISDQTDHVTPQGRTRTALDSNQLQHSTLHADCR